MTDDPRTKLVALLMRLGAADLAAQLWAVRDVRELLAREWWICRRLAQYGCWP